MQKTDTYCFNFQVDLTVRPLYSSEFLSLLQAQFAYPILLLLYLELLYLSVTFLPVPVCNVSSPSAILSAPFVCLFPISVSGPQRPFLRDLCRNNSLSSILLLLKGEKTGLLKFLPFDVALFSCSVSREI